MARVEHTPVDAGGAYGAYGANAVDISFTAADTTNKERVKLRRGELIIAQNSDASAHSVTVTSVDDKYGRQEDITYSVGASEYAVIGPFLPHGWQQSDGYLYFEADNTNVSFAIVRITDY